MLVLVTVCAYEKTENPERRIKRGTIFCLGIKFIAVNKTLIRKTRLLSLLKFTHKPSENEQKACKYAVINAHCPLPQPIYGLSLPKGRGINIFLRELGKM
jgi:hypothetical protein